MLHLHIRNKYIQYIHCIHGFKMLNTTTLVVVFSTTTPPLPAAAGSGLVLLGLGLNQVFRSRQDWVWTGLD